MAILTGPEIRYQQQLGHIVVEPWNPQFIGPNSIDLHLGDELLVYARRGMAIDSRKPPLTTRHRIRVDLDGTRSWLLMPGRLYLGATKEYTETRGYVPIVDGRSSIGRLGLFVHVTAGRGDNGFCGNWTLELVTVEPIIIYAGQRIAQQTFHTIEGEPALYGETGNTSGRYQGDRTPQGIKVDARTQHPAE